MPELKSFRQRADRSRLPAFETLHLQQQQILLRLDAGGAGRGLANSQEPANLISQVREGWIVQAVVSCRAERSAECHRRSVYHFTIYFISLSDILDLVPRAVLLTGTRRSSDTGSRLAANLKAQTVRLSTSERDLRAEQNERRLQPLVESRKEVTLADLRRK